MSTALSTNSVRFVKDVRRNQLSTKIINKAKKTQYINEISAVFQRVMSESKFEFGKWKMQCDMDERSVLHCSFEAAIKNNDDLFLEVTFDPCGTSYLTAGTTDLHDFDETSMNLLSKFERTPAFKRYFEVVDDNHGMVRAILPSRQITSRYLSDYLVHIVDQLGPLFHVLTAQRKRLCQAA